MEIGAIERSYARWAPIYDHTFGALTNVGRRRAAAIISRTGGSVLEVGVGTGLALGFYGPGVRVTGIDYSPDMLDKARRRVAARRLDTVAALHRMDARSLEFPDNSFDHVAAMHVISVVPEPERVMGEIARVLRPGGSAIIVNHFARTAGALAMAERAAAPMAHLLGWHSDFDRGCVLADPRLVPAEEHTLPPLGMMTLLRLEKRV